MIDGKYVAGPRLLYVEFVSFLVVMFCFARVATFDVLDWSAPLASGFEGSREGRRALRRLRGAAYFSAREVGQIKAARAIELIELAQPEGSNRDAAEGLAVWALLIPRLVVGFVVCLPFLPVFLVFFGLECADKEYWRGWILCVQKTGSSKPSATHLHDPLTFLGLPRAWRGDYWNWIDAATIGCAWAAFGRAATPGTNLSTDHAAATAMLLWLRLFGFLKNINQSLATFVLMFERIVRDLRVFMVFSS